MVEGGSPSHIRDPELPRTPVRFSGRAGAARARGRCDDDLWVVGPFPAPSPFWGRRRAVTRRGMCGAQRAGRVGDPPGAGWLSAGSSRAERGAQTRAFCRRAGVRGARGRERAGPTRSHPEPGRDPAQRRRVLWGRPHGRRGRRGHPPPSHAGAGARRRSGADSTMASRPRTRRGVEQRQLVGLITQRSGVRIPPPLPQRKSDRAILLGRFLLF
jgi:hypothetical protein